MLDKSHDMLTAAYLYNIACTVQISKAYIVLFVSKTTRN